MFHRSLSKAYICATLILIGCLLPGSSLPSVKTDSIAIDKLVHLLMYVPLAWTLVYGFKLQMKYPNLQKKCFLYAFIISCLYGALIELLQFTFTSDRYAEFYDFIADIIGAGLGLLTYSWGESLIRFWNRIFRVK